MRLAASSGAQALKIAREAERDHQPFKMILVDFQMPGMDGFRIGPPDAVAILAHFRRL